MKTIGLLGGMSWKSTAVYYEAINEGVKAALGGLHSAKVCLHSVDFDEVQKLQRKGDWSETAILLARAAASIEAGGADFLVICTNTMHKVAPQIEAAISIPLVHIADATAERLVEDHVRTVGLLGTRFTMQQEFYKGRITDKFGISVIVPEVAQQETVHDIIYSELCQGIISEDSRAKYLKTIDHLQEQGAEAIILGCTEIGLLVQQSHTSVPIYDTTLIHADRAVKIALSSTNG